MPSLNVRSLISKFEQLSTEIDKQNSKSIEQLPISETKTSTTPKAVPTKPPTYTPANKSCVAKLSDIDRKIEDVQYQIRCQENISTDEFIRILFLLLNLLIELGSIDADGVYNVKQKKSVCFKGIIDCKEQLVKCMDEDFVNNEVVTFSSRENINVSPPKEEFEEENQENVAPRRKSVSQLKNQWETIAESTSRYSADSSESVVTVIQKSPPSPPAPTTYEIPVLLRNKEEESPVTTRNNEQEIKPIRESLQACNLQSVKELKNKFETPKLEDSKKDISTLQKLIRQLSSDEEPDTIELQVQEKSLLEQQTSLMETLWTEIEYYKYLVADLDPNDIARAEVLEENLVELFLELNKFDTLSDPALDKKKVNGIAIAESIQKKIDEKKTSLGLYTEPIENEGEEVEYQAEDPMTKMAAFCSEVDRYKEMIEGNNSLDVVKTEVLQQNICEVIEELNNFEAIKGELVAKKDTAINQLNALLVQLNTPVVPALNLQDSLEDFAGEIERYKFMVDNLRVGEVEENRILEDHIYQTLVDLEKLEVPQEQALFSQQKLQGIKELTAILRELHRHTNPMIQICPAKPETSEAGANDNSVETNDSNGEGSIYEEFLSLSDKSFDANQDVDEIYKEPRSLSGSKLYVYDTEEVNTNEKFDEICEMSEAEESRNAHLFDAVSTMDDIAVEVKIVADLSKELDILNKSDFDIFSRNVEEIVEKLKNLQTYADEELEDRKSSALLVLDNIQQKFKESVN